MAADAWAAFAAGDTARGLAEARDAADLDDHTEKHPVTPGPVLPPRELYAEMLLKAGRPAEARARFEAALARHPNRARSLAASRRAEERKSRRADELPAGSHLFCRASALLLYAVRMWPSGQLSRPRRPPLRGPVRPPAPDTTPDQIRVVTFNVKYAAHVDRAIEVLQESDSLRGADIIALQEMNDGATDSMARALRMNYAYLPSTISPITDTFFGPALLSRWPIDSAWKVLLPHASIFRGQRRTATAAIVRSARNGCGCTRCTWRPSRASRPTSGWTRRRRSYGTRREPRSR